MCCFLVLFSFKRNQCEIVAGSAVSLPATVVVKGDCVWDENHSIESDQAKSPIKFILSSIGYHSFRGSFIRTIARWYKCNMYTYYYIEYINSGYDPVMQRE